MRKSHRVTENDKMRCFLTEKINLAARTSPLTVLNTIPTDEACAFFGTPLTTVQLNLIQMNAGIKS